jgi:hypothetical protein
MRFTRTLLRFGLPAVILTAITLIAACSSDGSDASPTTTPVPQQTTQAAPGETVTLAPGQSVGIDGEDIELAFYQVVDESRCPEGAQCITAGTATVLMSLTGPDFDSGQISFFVPPGGSSTAVAGPYDVNLIALEPDPPPKGGVEAGDYRVTFSVTKN